MGEFGLEKLNIRSKTKRDVKTVRTELIRFFESSTGRTVFPLQCNAKTPLTLVFSKRPYWVELLQALWAALLVFGRLMVVVEEVTRMGMAWRERKDEKMLGYLVT